MKLHITFEVNPGELWEDYYLSNTHEIIEVTGNYIELRQVGKQVTYQIPPAEFYKKLRKIG